MGRLGAHLVAAAACLLTALAGAPAHAQGQQKVGHYVVQPGDSCWSVAEKLFGDGAKYTEIHKYNKLGPMPHVLEPGQVLRIPGDDVLPDARVDWFRRDVTAKAPGAAPWRRAKKDMPLWRLHKVATGEDSSAEVVFLDESGLQLRENALLVIYGSSASRVQKAVNGPTRVRLEKGTLKAGLAALDGETKLTIDTPASEVDLMSRSSQIEVDDAQMCMVSVHDGDATVKAQGAAVKVPVDYGTVVSKGARPKPPRPLPPTPKWSADAADSSIVLVAPGHTGEFQARWEPVKAAERYRVELARDEGFKQLVVDAIVGAAVHELAAKRMAPGKYWARLASIDSDKLESRPGKALPVEVATLDSSRRLEAADGNGAGEYEVAGLVQIAPPAPYAEQLELSVDGGPYFPATDSVRLWERGLYTIRYRRGPEHRPSRLAVRVLELHAELRGPDDKRRDAKGPATAKLELRDERDRPVALPGLALGAVPGGTLELRVAAPGAYVATVPPPVSGQGDTVALAAYWPGGELARTEIRFDVPPPPAPPPRGWNELPVASEWRYDGSFTAARSADPDSFIGIALFGTTTAATEGLHKDRSVRLDLRGSLALLDRDLAIDAGLPLLASGTKDDPPDEPALGNASLGLRYVLIRTGGLVLTPTARLIVPTATGARERDRLGVAPGLLVRYAWGERAALTMAQNVLFRWDGDEPARVNYSASYGGAMRVAEWLSVSTELDTLLGPSSIEGLSADAAFGFGAALVLHLGDYRLALDGAAGLGERGARRLGRTVGLTIAYGFPGR